MVMHHRLSGRFTNLFIGGDELRKETNAGTLFAMEYDGGLIMLCKRQNFSRLYYAVNPDLPLPTIPEKALVCEHVFRAGETPHSPTILTQAGLEAALYRVRLANSPQETAVMPKNVIAGDVTDAKEVMKLLVQNFHPVTGCLPTVSELLTALENGQILCIKDENRILGILDYRENRAAAEIRHLAIDSRARRQGCATKLMQGFFAKTSKRSVVWTGADNIAALAFYKKCGFTPDGMNSVVLWKGIE